jgi:hypothetical protein
MTKPYAIIKGSSINHYFGEKLRRRNTGRIQTLSSLYWKRREEQPLCCSKIRIGMPSYEKRNSKNKKQNK